MSELIVKYHDRALKAEARIAEVLAMCEAAVEKKLKQRVPPFGAVVTVERLRKALRD